MVSLPVGQAEAPGTMPGASALTEFVSICNSIVLLLSVLADEVRPVEPGTAEVITAYSESISGQALDLVLRWPGVTELFKQLAPKVARPPAL